MASPMQRRRRLLEVQGFDGLDDATIGAVEPWLRMAPAILLVWTAAGVVTCSAPTLWAAVPFSLGAVVLRNHPFDVLYNHGLRHLTGGPRLPRYGRERRLAWLLSSGWLAVTGLLFHLGMSLAATAVGSLLLAVEAILVGTGRCVPSYLLRRLPGRRPHAGALAP